MSTEKKKMTLSKVQLDNMIQEEVQNMIKEKNLKNRLKVVNESLAKLNESDTSLMDEVEADGEMKVPSSAWTGKRFGDTKNGVKFEKKGSHLLENGEEMGEIEAALASVGRDIDMKLAAAGCEKTAADDFGDGMAVGSSGSEDMGDDENKDDDFEEIEISDDAEKTPEETETETEEEKEALQEAGENTKKGLEIIKGKSVAQMTDKDAVNSNMTKSDIVAEEKKEVVSEGLIKKSLPIGTILTEGKEGKDKAKILSEIARNRRLAGLTSDDEGIDIIKG